MNRSVGFSEVSAPDEVERPHLLWWVAILGGLTLLGFQGFSAAFYSWWIAHVNWLPGREYMRALFIACIPIHVYEAAYVYRLCHRLGMRNAAVGWSVQTFFLGFPSTYLARRRALRARASGGR
jgi:Domain of unknown function (DUF4499)